MKYKCSDGVNRDQAIDRYLEVSALVRKLIKEIQEKNQELDKAMAEQNNLLFSQLGLSGLAAVREIIDG